jgi:hypothetical protein
MSLGGADVDGDLVLGLGVLACLRLVTSFCGTGGGGSATKALELSGTGFGVCECMWVFFPDVVLWSTATLWPAPALHALMFPLSGKARELISPVTLVRE